MTLPWPFRMSGLLQVVLSRYSSLRRFILVSLVKRKKAKRRTGIQDRSANQTVYTQEHMEQIHVAPCERAIVSKSGARARGLDPEQRGDLGFQAHPHPPSASLFSNSCLIFLPALSLFIIFLSPLKLSHQNGLALLETLH